ncbi:MAG: HAMP domain-containing histidine kinase, partial [Actinomycetota bacterium]|nr:HAMP domain-containing histidine kinase [Actinomycetota bacterium]
MSAPVELGDVRQTGRIATLVDSLRAAVRGIPLRVRLLTVVAVLLAAALAASSIIVTVLMRSYLLDRTDEELRTYGEIAAAVAYSSGGAQTIQPNFTVRLFRPDGSGGIKVAEAATEPNAEPAIPALTSHDPRVTSGQPFTLDSTSADDEDLMWRAIAGLNQDRDAIYIVAVPMRQLEATLGNVLGYAALIGLVVLAAAMGVGWYAVRRAFRPLTQIEDTAATIAAGDLTQRVPEPATRDEVASLSRSLNAMLAQIEQSFAVREASEEHMRQFVADASHELRTPLATVRGYAELYRQGAVSKPEDVSGAFARIESEASRMSGLVEDLLVLARLEGERPLSIADVDLAVLAGDATQDARVLAPDRHVRLVGLGGPIAPVHVAGDEQRLRQVITNLVSNALNHTPAGTPIEIAVGARPNGMAALEVRDHGDGIDPGRARRVFERFYREDPSRSRRGSGGTGLGLAIAAAIVTAHHGKVGV